MRFHNFIFLTSLSLFLNGCLFNRQVPLEPEKTTPQADGKSAQQNGAQSAPDSKEKPTPPQNPEEKKTDNALQTNLGTNAENAQSPKLGFFAKLFGQKKPSTQQTQV
jgi:hypothetical protein